MAGGMPLRNPDPAAVLKVVGRNGLGTCYRGEIAAEMAAAIKKRDGFVTPQDLAGHRSQWVEPLSVRYRDLTVFELPPPTQGLTALAMLARLDRLAPAQMQTGVDFVTAFKRIRDECYALRDRYITDPEFSVAPLEPFLDASHATVGPSQVLLTVGDRGLEPAETGARPRIRAGAGGEVISVEANDPDVREINRSGLHIELMPPGHHSLGHAPAIVIDGPGAWRAGADPRSDGSVEIV